MQFVIDETNVLDVLSALNDNQIIFLKETKQVKIGELITLRAEDELRIKLSSDDKIIYSNPALIVSLMELSNVLYDFQPIPILKFSKLKKMVGDLFQLNGGVDDTCLYHNFFLKQQMENFYNEYRKEDDSLELSGELKIYGPKTRVLLSYPLLSKEHELIAVKDLISNNNNVIATYINCNNKTLRQPICEEIFRLSNRKYYKNLNEVKEKFSDIAKLVLIIKHYHSQPNPLKWATILSSLFSLDVKDNIKVILNSVGYFSSKKIDDLFFEKIKNSEPNYAKQILEFLLINDMIPNSVMNQNIDYIKQILPLSNIIEGKILTILQRYKLYDVEEFNALQVKALIDDNHVSTSPSVIKKWLNIDGNIEQFKEMLSDKNWNPAFLYQPISKTLPAKYSTTDLQLKLSELEKRDFFNNDSDYLPDLSWVKLPLDVNLKSSPKSVEKLSNMFFQKLDESFNHNSNLFFKSLSPLKELAVTLMDVDRIFFKKMLGDMDKSDNHNLPVNFKVSLSTNIKNYIVNNYETHTSWVIPKLEYFSEFLDDKDKQWLNKAGQESLTNLFSQSFNSFLFNNQQNIDSKEFVKIRKDLTSSMNYINEWMFNKTHSDINQKMNQQMYDLIMNYISKNYENNPALYQQVPDATNKGLTTLALNCKINSNPELKYLSLLDNNQYRVAERQKREIDISKSAKEVTTEIPTNPNQLELTLD